MSNPLAGVLDNPPGAVRLRPMLASALHGLIWRKLPHRLRRTFLLAAMRSLAPRPTPGARPSLPIIVAGTFRTASGLGQSARLCHEALRGAGVPVYGIDLTREMMQPADLPAFPHADGRQVKGPATLILHVNAPLVPLALWRLGAKVVAGRHVVGYWAWELPEVPGDWAAGPDYVHAIWAPSRFSSDAMRRVARDRPVHTLWHPLPAPVEEGPGKPQGAFTVLTVFNMASSFERKNPLAAAEAFRRAFGTDPSARLVVKCANPDVYPEGMRRLRRALQALPNAEMLTATMTAAEIHALLRDSDVLLSLHRSEGFGLPIAEAMLAGVPTVSTAWSGNTDFVGPDTGMLVGYRLIPTRDPQGTYHHPDMLWAEPDVDAAAAALTRLRDDPELRAGIGRRARLAAETTFAPAAYARKVLQLLGLSASRAEHEPP